MPYTCVVDRPDLQDVLLKRVSHNLRNDAAVESYKDNTDGSVTAILADGTEVHGDVLIGADGIWSKVYAVKKPEQSEHQPTSPNRSSEA